MGEPLAKENNALLTRLSIAITSVLATLVLGIGIWGLNLFSAQFDDIKGEVSGIRNDVRDVRREVQALLLTEPRIGDLERRIERLESLLDRHAELTAHRDHALHPHAE